MLGIKILLINFAQSVFRANGSRLVNQTTHY